MLPHFSIIIAAILNLIIGLFDKSFALVPRLVQNKWSSKANNHLFDMIGRKGNILAPFTIPASYYSTTYSFSAAYFQNGSLQK